MFFSLVYGTVAVESSKAPWIIYILMLQRVCGLFQSTKYMHTASRGISAWINTMTNITGP